MRTLRIKYHLAERKFQLQVYINIQNFQHGAPHSQGASHWWRCRQAEMQAIHHDVEIDKGVVGESEFLLTKGKIWSISLS